MANSVYVINKGINAPITFKGLKAQYIWWLGRWRAGPLYSFRRAVYHRVEHVCLPGYRRHRRCCTLSVHLPFKQYLRGVRADEKGREAWRAQGAEVPLEKTVLLIIECECDG